MPEKKQILFIGGGEIFDTKEEFLNYLRNVPIDPYDTSKRWRNWLSEELAESHEVLIPTMPCKQNADYDAWKIWLERYLAFIKGEPIFIGHSLGGSLFLKYLSENKLPFKISSLHLVAPWLGDKGSFKTDVGNLSKISDSIEEIHIWHSQDDSVVSFKNAELVKQYIPEAVLHSFKDRKHFNESTFIELLQSIQAK
jgi:predicted alpha/beta hydrolase family esterase